MQPQRALGSILARQGIVANEILESLYEQQVEKGLSLVDLLVSTQTASLPSITRGLATECGLAFIDAIEAERISIATATRLPIAFSRSHKILVTAEHEHHVEVITGDPLDTMAIDDVRACFNKPVRAVAAPPDVVENAINRVYERQETSNELQSTDEEADEGEQVTGRQVKCLDVYAPTGGREVTLSFCAWAEDFARLEPEFDRWLSTLTFSRPPKGKQELSDRLWTPLLTGGVVGIILLVLYKHTRRAR
jgi:hypothetical protein